ncbi:hypothetical protein BDBG_17596 [Blastomyces gilchristii SLH14081]|uniref:Uncharacterized protein n=1 Tax=Blastomyces gilchristii (strain SLH14081) TaxID=559298 RepID=A0A179UXF3_BLAGS|nr:uncharacterized protein BDBG_17596 [Blastomyces gilchristii SLH14081]OAT11909.1 hypothetical protein BDBG_17596 [Blastomyces gilchristii SLH14081]
MRIELLEATVPRTKLSLSSSLNDHTGSYTTVLAGRGGGVTTAVGGAEDRPDADALTGRTTAATREAGGGVAMRAVLPRLIDTTVSNLAFLMATEAAAAP